MILIAGSKFVRITKKHNRFPVSSVVTAKPVSIRKRKIESHILTEADKQIINYYSGYMLKAIKPIELSTMFAKPQTSSGKTIEFRKWEPIGNTNH